jgi:hypothetical protein
MGLTPGWLDYKPQLLLKKILDITSAGQEMAQPELAE